MKLLLDTQVLLWLLLDPSRIPPPVSRAIQDDRADVCLSAVVLWEIAIKSGLGKLTVPADLPEHVGHFGFRSVPITPEHAWAVRSLPPLHGDPFDRLLIAQSRLVDATLVTADAQIAKYDVPVLWG